MNQMKIALEALDASIVHWKDKLANPLGVRIGRTKCPLCRLYNERFDGCNLCPIAIMTGKDYCKNTPYNQARTYRIRAINRELSFLYEVRLFWINRMNRG